MRFTEYMRAVHSTLVKEKVRYFETGEELAREMNTLQEKRARVVNSRELTTLDDLRSELERSIEENEVNKLIMEGVLEQMYTLRSEFLNSARRETITSSRSPSQRSPLTITGDRTVDMYNAVQGLSGRGRGQQVISGLRRLAH